MNEWIFQATSLNLSHSSQQELVYSLPYSSRPLLRSVAYGVVEDVALLGLLLSDHNKLLHELFVFDILGPLQESCAFQPMEILLQHGALLFILWDNGCHVPQGYVHRSLLGGHLSNRILKLGKQLTKKDLSNRKDIRNC